MNARGQEVKLAFAVSREWTGTGSWTPRKLVRRQTGRLRQTRSARVRETFRLCPGGEQFTSCSLSEDFFPSRLDGRVERAFMLLSSLVATRDSPPEDRQFLSRPCTKNQRAILISFFAAFAETAFALRYMFLLLKSSLSAIFT